MFLRDRQQQVFWVEYLQAYLEDVFLFVGKPDIADVFSYARHLIKGQWPTSSEYEETEVARGID